MGRFDDFFGTLRMRIGDKQLSEKFVINHSHYFPHAGFVKLVKNIIEEQNGILAALFFYKFKLGEFQGNQK